MCTSSVSDVIYHKFSHGAAFCTLNGKNVNVMLELMMDSFILRFNEDIYSTPLNISSNVHLFYRTANTLADFPISSAYRTI